MRKFVVIAAVFLTHCFGDFEAAAQTNSPSPQEVAREVITAFQTGHTAQLRTNLPTDIAVLEKGVKESPSDPMLHFGLATCYMEGNNIGAALTHMEIAYRASNKDASIGVMFALALKANKQPMEAYRLDKEMVELHPNVVQLQMSLATTDMTIQKYDEALAIFDALKQKFPTNSPSLERSARLLVEGICRLHKGEYTEAIGTLEKARSIMPQLASVLTTLGEAYLKNGDVDKAIEPLDHALAINPKIPVALYYRGIYYEKKGDGAKATKSYEDAYTYGKARLQDNGEDYYLMYLVCQKLAKMAEGAGYKAEAEKLFYTSEAPWRQR